MIDSRGVPLDRRSRPQLARACGLAIAVRFAGNDVWGVSYCSRFIPLRTAAFQLKFRTLVCLFFLFFFVFEVAVLCDRYATCSLVDCTAKDEVGLVTGGKREALQWIP